MNVRIVDHPRTADLELIPGAEIELGRQTEAEVRQGLRPLDVVAQPDGAVKRVIVGWNSESTDLSRRHVRLAADPDGRVRVTNLSETFKVVVSDPEATIAPGGTESRSPPFDLRLPGRTVTVGDDRSGRVWVAPLADRTVAPGADPATVARRPPPPVPDAQVGNLVGWLRTTIGVLQAAIGSPDFLDRAAAALVTIVGLRSGWVLLRRGDQWERSPVATHGEVRQADVWRPTDSILDWLVREKRPILPNRMDRGKPTAASVLGGLNLPDKAVVGAPLLDATNQVIGVLYGELAPVRGGVPVPPELTAALVEVLACGVSAGLARERHEVEALRNQARLEQIFSAPLARQLRNRADLFRVQTRDVTILFCDIRGYSAAAGDLGPERTETWLHDVLGTLSECVLAEGGVVVDYIGDELMAMWGAPEEPEDQTERAVRAGLAMVRALPELDRRWREIVGESIAVGVGIHRGPAQVGNIGSKVKLKYSAIGETVNVASRVQGMTKYLKCPLLVTREARLRLGDAFAARRVVKAQLVNVKRPADLYEVAPTTDDVRDFFRLSEEALDHLENGRGNAGELATAGRLAGELLGRVSGDGPMLLTLSRAAAALLTNGSDFIPEWVPPGK